MTLSHTSQRWDDEQRPCTRIESAGMMIHLTTWTRPELASVVLSLAKDSDPCRCGWVHVRAMARVVAYIAGTTSLGLRYVGSDTEDPGMVAWVDGGIGQGLPRDGAAAITDTVPNRLRQHGGMRGVRERGGESLKRKFIAIRYFLIRRAVPWGLLVLCSVPMDWNVADLFTKSRGWDKLRRFRDKTMNVAGRVVEDGESWLTEKGGIGRVC